MDQTQVDKAQEALFNEVYLPAFVETYNVKAASVGMPPITNSQELEQALALTDYIQTIKQASQVNPLNSAFQKLANVSGQNKQTNARVDAYVKAACDNKALLEAVKPLVS